MFQRRASIAANVEPVVRMREILGDQGPACVVVSGKITPPERREQQDCGENRDGPKVPARLKFRHYQTRQGVARTIG